MNIHTLRRQCDDANNALRAALRRLSAVASDEAINLTPNQVALDAALGDVARARLAYVDARARVAGAESVLVAAK